jgi:hypothetical protein
MSGGGVFKRCGCRSAETGRLMSSACPQLTERGHGSWYFDCAVPVLPGRRERLQRGGYPTRREAVAARDALLGGGDTATAEGWTVQRWLRYWLTTRTKIRPTTLRSYQIHVENHLIPHLGRVRLSDLAGRHITDMITTIAATENRYGRAPSPSTLHRIRATLRSALNAAVREGLLRDNPARHVEVPSPRRPHALVWTAQRVEAWQQTGERPAVAVRTTEQTATFLGLVANDRLAVMWWLIALRGLRRGEAAGLRWVDVDLDATMAVIEQQRIATGHFGHGRPTEDRREPPPGRFGPAHRAAATRAPPPATGGAAGGGGEVAGLRLRVRRGGRSAAAPGLPDPPLPPPGRRVRATADPAARPPARRRESRALRRRRSQDGAGAVGAQQHRADCRHLHQCPDRFAGVCAEATARLVLAAAARNPGRRHRRNGSPQKSAGPDEVASVERPVSRPSGHRKGLKQGRPHTSHRRPTKIKGV